MLLLVSIYFFFVFSQLEYLRSQAFNEIFEENAYTHTLISVAEDLNIGGGKSPAQVVGEFRWPLFLCLFFLGKFSLPRQLPSVLRIFYLCARLISALIFFYVTYFSCYRLDQGLCPAGWRQEAYP